MAEDITKHRHPRPDIDDRIHDEKTTGVTAGGRPSIKTDESLTPSQVGFAFRPDCET